MAAIDFNNTFGAPKAQSAAAAKSDRPAAQLWLNIGYDSGVVDDNGESRFVSLPVGIPLDTMEALPTNSRNQDYARFNAARNDLHDQIMAVAAQLQAGESRVLNLQIQLRRVNDAQPDVSAEGNQFVKALSL